MAGDEISVRGDMLRSTGLELIGSGIGSVASKSCWPVLGELLTAAATADFDVPFTSLPLRAVADAWNGAPEVRHILTPGL